MAHGTLSQLVAVGIISTDAGLCLDMPKALLVVPEARVNVALITTPVAPPLPWKTFGNRPEQSKPHEDDVSTRVL